MAMSRTGRRSDLWYAVLNTKTGVFQIIGPGSPEPFGVNPVGILVVFSFPDEDSATTFVNNYNPDAVR